MGFFNSGKTTILFCMDTQNYTPITQNPLPNLNFEQLEKFSVPAIHAEALTAFDATSSVERLATNEGARVIGADFGGDKGLTQLFVIKNGALVIDDTYSDYVQGNLGAGYLDSLKKTVAFAEKENIPIGVSWGAPLDGTKPLFHPKATVFLKEIAEQYDGDFKNISPLLKACYNDGLTGLVSGVVEANRHQPTSSVLFPINGGGIGMAALADNTLYSTEAGHVEGIQQLNRYAQTEACGVFDATYVCLERLGANKAGIEAQWQAKTGSYMRARDIEDRYKEGDAFAGELYDNSAFILAHVIQGSAKALNIDLADPLTAIVGHGGAFKFPHYGERIVQILAQHNGQPSRLIMTKDYGDSASNACLDGAALIALLT